MSQPLSKAHSVRPLGLPDANRSNRMRQVLQREVVPTLRSLGFRGTMPHFHRQRQDRLDLLNIQFSYNGQYFFVNLGRLQLPRDGSGVVLKPTKGQLNESKCPLDPRTRLATALRPQQLTGKTLPGFTMWDFTAASDAQADNRMQRLARQLTEFLPLYADPWWKHENLQGNLPQAPVGPE